MGGLKMQTMIGIDFSGEEKASSTNSAPKFFVKVWCAYFLN
jgi:hypothetical protein